MVFYKILLQYHTYKIKKTVFEKLLNWLRYWTFITGVQNEHKSWGIQHSSAVYRHRKNFVLLFSPYFYVLITYYHLANKLGKKFWYLAPPPLQVFKNSQKICLKLDIYNDVGFTTCQGYSGGFGYEEVDA